MNLTKELELAISTVQQMWAGIESQEAKQVLVDCFNRGLVDGRLWIEEHALFDLGESLNNGEMVCPVKVREESIGWDAARHDALCIFNDFVRSGLSNLRRVTVYPFSFSRNADAMVDDIRKAHSFSVSPIKATSAQSKKFIADYQGFHGEGAGSFGMIEKLTYSNSVYSKNDQGLEYDRQLFAAFYSHGLACSEKSNIDELIDVLSPIYNDLLNSAFNCDNGASIMELARKSKIVRVIEQLNAPEFSSTSDYEKELHDTQQRLEAIVNETAEQKKQRTEAFTLWQDELMQRACNPSEEELLATENEHTRYKAIVNEFPSQKPVSLF